MNVRELRENRKQQLLQQIAQQRQTLSLLKSDWLRLSEPVDRSWQALYRCRAFIVPGIGITALYALKSKPRRLIIWPRRAVAAWGAMKFIRQRIRLFR
ncbi:YqjK family protein [Serratia sp. 121840015-1]